MICPPETYQQWLETLNHLAEHPADRQALEAAARGLYPGRPTEAFLARLSDTASVMLTKNCRGFLRQLDRALEDNEPDMAPVLAVRFRRSVERCLFYRELAFLPEDYITTLDEGFAKQLQACWSDFLRQLRLNARDSADPRMEDVAVLLRRISIMPERRD